MRDGWDRFVRESLPGSGYAPGDGPALELYDTDFAVDEKTGAITCWLCLPVKAG